VNPAPFRPDTALADAAEDLLRASSPPVLVAHCLRTHAFAAGLLARSHRAYDPEVLFVAAALHDLGLVEAWEDGVTPFELRGAHLAREASLRAGADRAAADLVHDAIALHLEMSTASDARPEVAGVHLGAAVDVLGLRLDELPAGLLESALERWPRTGFTAYLVQAMADEAAAKPAARTAELTRDHGLLDLIAAAPFAE
jgi:hypothetical protein